jgi:hypothetical protein
VPVDDDRVGYGQIVHQWAPGNFYFALFDEVYPRDASVDLDEVLTKPLALLALAMDALLYHGHWAVVGHREVKAGRLPWPAYKEGVSPPGAFDVVDYTGRRRRRANEDEAERLPFRQVVAPIRVQKAFQALHGIGEWNESYDRLRPVLDELTSARMLPD